MLLLDISKVNSRLFDGAISHSQADGVSAILQGCLTGGLALREQIAYVLATAYHESSKHMQGIDEFGQGRGKPYGDRDAQTGQVYYGRGIVQLTWRSNYEHFGQLLKLDLVHHPELANELPTAVKICILGMKLGAFTGVALERFVNQSFVDYVAARKVVNGEDCAQLIALHAEAFADCISYHASQVA